MTSSSSLYGTVTTQNSSSSNSTSLYGGADTPIPDSSGNVVVRGDLYVLSGNILTTATTGNIFPTNATTINLGLAATAVNIGAGSGTTTINNDLVVNGTFVVPGAEFGNITIGVADDNTITTTTGALKLSSATGTVGLIGADTLYTDTTGTFLLLNAPTTIYAFDSATTLELGDVTGTTTVRNNLVAGGSITGDSGDFGNITIAVTDNQTIGTTAGELRLSSTSNAIKLVGTTSIYTDNTGTFNLLNQPTTVNAFVSATTLNIGANGGETNINNDLLVEGIGTFTGNITAPGADLGSITVGLGDDQTITTTVGELRVSSANGSIKLPSVNSVYTDTTGSFAVLNQPTTINAFLGATALNLGAVTGTTNINNNLLIDGTSVGLAQGTIISYSEANNRLNRPAVRSTSGNNSGWRVEAPNATANAISTLTAFNSNDNDNGKFININARGSAFTNDLRIQTGKYTAGVLGASGSVVSFIDNATLYATVNPAGPTDTLDLTTKDYVDSLVGTIPAYDTAVAPTTGGVELQLRELNPPSITIVGTTKFLGGTNITISETATNEITIDGTDLNTTYTQNISATTGGANLNLVGSDSTTDTVKFANGTGVDVSYTDANTATIAIGQAVGITDNVQFNGVTTNSITTGTVNANGGVSFVNTAPMGGTYATVNQNGPAVGTDLTTVDYVNSILPIVVTYAIDASSTTGGANLNLTGSDLTTDTVKVSSGTGVTVSQVNANELSVAIGQPVATSDSVTFADVSLDSLVNLNTATLTTTTTAANQVADSFVAATYRTCKYVIQITSGAVYQAVEALVVHDGATAYINTYSDVRTGANLTSINAAVNGANIELQVTPVNAATTYKISKTLIVV